MEKDYRLHGHSPLASWGILVEDPEQGIDAQQTKQKEQQDVGLH